MVHDHRSADLLAYHNDPAIKRDILAQLAAHRAADEIVQGIYWENGKGCAVGCTLHSDDHSQYERRFGIPRALARLEDAIFEGLLPAQAKYWPERFMCAIPPGADLSRVQWQFLHWLLTTPEVNPGITHPQVRESVARCADLMLRLSRGQKIHPDEARSAWSAAESAAWSAAESAWAAAEPAVWGLMADKLITLLEAAGDE